MVHVLDHLFGQDEGGAFALARLKPVLCAVQKVEGLLVVVEFGLAQSQVSEYFMDQGDTLHLVIVIL